MKKIPLTLRRALFPAAVSKPVLSAVEGGARHLGCP
jgi:hypothetical protein